jgi:hypothetical protein
MKRQHVKRNLVVGVVFGTIALWVNQALKETSGLVADWMSIDLAWVVVVPFGVSWFIAFVFGFVSGVCPILATMFYQHLRTKQ